MGARTSENQHWLFLRGLARESGHWHDFPARFEDKIRGSRVTFLDLPGTGEFFQTETPNSISEITAAAREKAGEFFRANSTPRFLFAISLGAMVGVEWITRFPGDFHGAVLLNTSLNGLSSLTHRLLPAAWLKLARIFLTRDVLTREKKILDLTAPSVEGRDEIARMRAEIYRLRPMKHRAVVRQLWAAGHYAKPQAKPSIPILLLNSLGDSLVNHQCSQALQSYWHTELATHPTAGHDLPLVAPDWICDEVAKWLANLPTPPAKPPAA